MRAVCNDFDFDFNTCYSHAPGDLCPLQAGQTIRCLDCPLKERPSYLLTAKQLQNAMSDTITLQALLQAQQDQWSVCKPSLVYYQAFLKNNAESVLFSFSFLCLQTM